MWLLGVSSGITRHSILQLKPLYFGLSIDEILQQYYDMSSASLVSAVEQQLLDKSFVLEKLKEHL